MERRWRRLLVLAIGAPTFLALAALADSQPRIARQVVGGGGGTLASEQISLTGTVGQPAVGFLDPRSEQHVTLRSGFWHPASATTGVASDEIPDRPQLIGNAPNPFNPMTEIRFAVGRQARHARLTVHDLQGRRVRTLVDGVVTPGIRKATWRGEDERGRRTASGVYFYRLEVGGEVFTQKMLLVK